LVRLIIFTLFMVSFIIFILLVVNLTICNLAMVGKKVTDMIKTKVGGGGVNVHKR
jgi:hypothetical protein